MEDENIQAALDGDKDVDLPGLEEEKNPDDEKVQDEMQEDDEEELQDGTQDDEEQQPTGTIGDHVVQEDANTYHGWKVAAVQCIQALEGNEVIVKSGRNREVRWTAVSGSDPTDEGEANSNRMV